MAESPTMPRHSGEIVGSTKAWSFSAVSLCMLESPSSPESIFIRGKNNLCENNARVSILRHYDVTDATPRWYFALDRAWRYLLSSARAVPGMIYFCQEIWQQLKKRLVVYSGANVARRPRSRLSSTSTLRWALASRLLMFALAKRAFRKARKVFRFNDFDENWSWKRAKLKNWKLLKLKRVQTN